MKSRWLIATILLLNVTGICSQNNSSLFLKHHGLWKDPYKMDYVRANLVNGDEAEIDSLLNYYDVNKEEILGNMDVIVIDEIVAERKANAVPRSQVLAELGTMALETTVNIVGAVQEQKALEAQQEAIIKEQNRQRLAQNTAINKQKVAEFNAMRNNTYTITSSAVASTSQTQNLNSNITTSDGNMQRAIQMSNAAYGNQATANALNQQKQNNYSNSANGGYGGQVIQAVMSNGRAIKIQVRGGKVVAYSTGMQGTTQNWAPANGAVLRTAGVGNRLEAEYSYKTSFFMGNSNVTVYFDM